MRRIVQHCLITFLILALVAGFFPSSANAQAGSASDLISTVNQLRESLGLAPYIVDSFLMGYAQSHSDYMASIGRWSHTRADGTTSFDFGIKENVATGSDMSVEKCVHTIWADWVHWQTMTGFATGRVGAGVAVADGIVYYTLNVLPGDEVVSQPAPTSQSAGTVAQTTLNQPITIAQVITSTPSDDESIIHTVSSGETLWTISQAYDVPIDQILTNSGLSLGTTQLIVGQNLVIIPAADPTATPTITNTPTPVTPTPTIPRPTMTPFPTRTPLPTPTPTLPPTALQVALSDSRNVGMGLVLASGLGLLIVVYLGFVRKR